MNEPWPGYNQALADGRITVRGVNPNSLIQLEPIDADAEEKELAAAVAKLAKEHGWKRYHTYNSRKSEAGFPDEVLVRERVVYAELKSADGKLSADQLNWRDALLEAGQEWYEWRPEDWPEIFALLSAPRPPSPSANKDAGLSPDHP